MDTPGYDVTGRSAFERNLLALEREMIQKIFVVAVTTGRIDLRTILPFEMRGLVTQKVMEN